MKWRSKKTLFLGIGTALALFIVLGLLFGSDEKRTPVSVDVAYRDEISEIVTASGRVQPQTKVDITSQVSAQIVRLFVKDGDHVERGQPLLLLDTVQLKTDVTQAEYMLEELTARSDAARSTFERDRLEYERQQKLRGQNLTSETALTDAQFAFESSHAAYQAVGAQTNTARAGLEKARDNLSKTLITAPMPGKVTSLACEVGEIAQAQTSFTQGKTLLTISDLAVFEVEVDVDETEVAKVEIGQETKIRIDAFADTTFAGYVVEIGNSALLSGQGTENYTTSFRVKVRFAESHESIRPGMSATVDITTSHVEDALLIPYAAVVTREFDNEKKKSETDSGGGVQAAESDSSTVQSTADSAAAGHRHKKIKKTGVFVCRGGAAHFVEITTGIADDRNIVALTGLAPGDTVISGSFQTLRKLKDDESVKIEARNADETKS
jgi:HlyD family secretion protein